MVDRIIIWFERYRGREFGVSVDIQANSDWQRQHHGQLASGHACRVASQFARMLATSPRSSSFWTPGHPRRSPLSLSLSRPRSLSPFASSRPRSLALSLAMVDERSSTASAPASLAIPLCHATSVMPLHKPRHRLQPRPPEQFSPPPPAVVVSPPPAVVGEVAPLHG